MSLQDIVLNTIQKHEMLPPDTAVIVGFSGGADSVTLLHLLHSLRQRLCITELVAVHIDHRLRGEESARDRQFCEQLCQTWNIPLQVFTYDVAALAAESGRGVEDMGRQLRYQAFEQVADGFPHSVIATAHTADDNRETVLLHLSRGCGVHGLTGIPPKRETIIRPLIASNRAEIEAYCAGHGLPYVTDSTNRDVTYARNRIRHEVLPLLRTINPSVDRALDRLIVQMRETDAHLQREVDALWPFLLTDRAGIYQKEVLLQTDDVLQGLLLQRILKEQGIGYDGNHIRRMRRTLVTGESVSLPDDFRFFSHRDKLYLTCEKRPVDLTERPLSFHTDCFDIGGVRYRLVFFSRQEYEQKINICNLVFKNACDYDMIDGALGVRTRRAGDAYHPAGRHCGKTLKKLFNEAAILPDERERIPILCDERGIVMVVGFGCDERVRITDQTKRVMLIEKVEE